MSDLISRNELLKRFLVNKDGNRIPERDWDNFEVTISIKDIKRIIKEQPTVSDDVCEWRLCDEEANVYDTSCRNPHILINGTPEDNNYEYCPYCGKKILCKE